MQLAYIRLQGFWQIMKFFAVTVSLNYSKGIQIWLDYIVKILNSLIQSQALVLEMEELVFEVSSFQIYSHMIDYRCY